MFLQIYDVFVLCFKIFHLLLVLNYLIMVCLDVIFLFPFFFLYLQDIHWASEVCGLIVFIKYSKLSTIISLNVFSVPPFLWKLQLHIYLGDRSYPTAQWWAILFTQFVCVCVCVLFCIMLLECFQVQEILLPATTCRLLLILSSVFHLRCLCCL